MVYIGKYDGYVHTLSNDRFIVGIEPCYGGVSTLNPPLPDDVLVRRIRPLTAPLHAETFEELAELGAPTYANVNAAIKAARRVYPVLAAMFPWRPTEARLL
jgi:hypothetical protein